MVVVFCYFIAFGGKCQKEVDCDGGKCFNLDTFSANIKKALNGKCVGYGFTIYYNGKLERFFTDGLKRTQVDGGNLPFDNFAKMHIASMSKTLTAIATLQLLKKNNLTTYTKIKNYLPSDWQLGPNVDKITFRDLMKHEAGIRVTNTPNCNGDSYDMLKCKIKEGVNSGDMGAGHSEYQNMNFSLLRILISKLAGFQHKATGNDVFTANNYVKYVQDNILTPCSVTNGNCFPDPASQQYYYDWPYNNTKGSTFADYTLNSGAFGWYLSVTDYGNIISKLFNSQDLLTNNWRDTMTNNYLGCGGYGGLKGDYKWHNGGWAWVWTVNNVTTSGQLNTCWMYYPNNVIAVVHVNSGPIPDWFPNILAGAYDKSWVAQN
jgi:CubicO group peptidase (beta-lactamase class C family)